jgi:hypothetical protein
MYGKPEKQTSEILNKYYTNQRKEETKIESYIELKCQFKEYPSQI